MPARLSIPQRLPVMLLSGCNLFPQGLLPLHIFEPRYRMMLAEALQTDRMFCIGTLLGPEETLDPEDCVHHTSTAAFIRACVTQPDGCSNLLLQGVKRVQLSDFQTDRPYVTAAITPIVTDPGVIEEVEELSEGIRCQAMELMDTEAIDISEQVRDHLDQVVDPETLGDLIAYHFIAQPEERHILLETACLTTRLKELRKLLDRRRIREPSEDSP